MSIDYWILATHNNADIQYNSTTVSVILLKYNQLAHTVTWEMSDIRLKVCVWVCLQFRDQRHITVKQSYYTQLVLSLTFFLISPLFLFLRIHTSVFLSLWLILSSTVGRPHTRANTHTPLASFTEDFTAVVSEWSDLWAHKQKEKQKCLLVCHTDVHLNISFRPAVQSHTTLTRWLYLGDECTLQHGCQSGECFH